MESLFPLRFPACGVSPPPCLLRPGTRTLRVSSTLRYIPPPRATDACPVDLSWEGGEVDVIGIGSRKDAIIDFCLASPSPPSSRLRFWTIQSRDSTKVQLLHKSSAKEMDSLTVNCPLQFSARCPGIILVATAGHVPDDEIAFQLLNGVKSTGGLSIAILLKPFSFEGQRRLLEVNNLMGKLQNCSHLYIVVEVDALPKTKEETLEEAVKSVNYAVSMAINLISSLMTDKQTKFLDQPNEQVKELRFAEILELLGNYGESKICYGSAYDVKCSIMQAISNCPFNSNDLKGENGMVVLAVTSSTVIDRHELRRVVLTFRKITKCSKKIIFVPVCQTDNKQELVMTTLLFLGCTLQNATPQKGVMSAFFLYFPSLLSNLWRNSGATIDTHIKSGNPPSSNCLSLNNECLSELDGKNPSTVFASNFEPKSRTFGCENAEEANLPVANNESDFDDNGFLEEQHDNWILGPAFDFAQKWAKERSSLPSSAIKLEGVDTFILPVGVKFSGNCYDECQLTKSADPEPKGVTGGKCSDILYFQSKVATTDTSLEAFNALCNSGVSLSQGKDMFSKKPRSLFVRAASMLESERESEKKWAPYVEMEYRGGFYKGRCQGGLPEGKGCITFNDGSFYDGTWQYGKRAGLGIFCYSNGDMYQGMWRDDFIHGKGWFYFHTGDRWFANFWKGKANGDGRFYSISGSVFFGHFRNGWRHGESIVIDANGSRWTELWEEGVLISRTEVK